MASTDNATNGIAVFSKCGQSVQQGRRLENLSWRLWTRETFCVEDNPKAKKDNLATNQPHNIPTVRIQDDIPQLSGSVESVADMEEVIELNNEVDPLECRPVIRRQDSCASSRSRGRERHITSGDLEKMVVDIIHKKESLSDPLPPIPYPVAEEQPVLERSGSTTTETTSKASDDQYEESDPSSSVEVSNMKCTTVVRGFSPPSPPSVRVISPAASQPSHVIPEPKSSPAPKHIQPKKPARFALGGSSSPDSSSDVPLGSLERRRMVPQRKMFKAGPVSSDESSGQHSIRPSMLPKNAAAFSAKVASSMQNSSAVADDSEDESVDESAIDDDDDSSDWEDSIEDSGKSSFDDKAMFQRVDSKANLTSRRSLITLMVQNEQRSRRLGGPVSQSTSALSRTRSTQHSNAPAASSPNDSDDAPLMMRRPMRGTPLKPINEISRTGAQPIMATNHGHAQAALSPRTTRRNMLATELTESLRRHLLWERQQKSSTVNAVLKRRHTSHDVANLKQYPEKVYMNKNEDANASSWNEYWTKEAFSGYHTQGW